MDVGSHGAHARRRPDRASARRVVVAAGLDEATNSAFLSGVASISNGARRTGRVGCSLSSEAPLARARPRRPCRRRCGGSRVGSDGSASPAGAGQPSVARSQVNASPCMSSWKARGGGAIRASSVRLSAGWERRCRRRAGWRGAPPDRRATAGRRASGRRARAGLSRRSHPVRRSKAASPRRRGRRRRRGADRAGSRTRRTRQVAELPRGWRLTPGCCATFRRRRSWSIVRASAVARIAQRVGERGAGEESRVSGHRRRDAVPSSIDECREPARPRPGRIPRRAA